MKKYVYIVVISIFAVILYGGCKKESIVDADANLVGEWQINVNIGKLCTVEIKNDNNLNYRNQICGHRECFEEKSGEAKVRNDYIYLKNKYNIFVKAFHIDKYPWQELTYSSGTPVMIWKIRLTGGEKQGRFENEEIIRK